MELLLAEIRISRERLKSSQREMKSILEARLEEMEANPEEL
jgi:hypothetical protein